MAAAGKNLASNRKALRDFFVIDRLEAGVELKGTEVKSIRAGHISLVGSYAQIENGQAILYGVTVQPYEFGNRFNHESSRPRRLLLHKREILKLQVETEQKGHTLIPLNVYLKRGHVKVQIGLCKGKQAVDKRETLRAKTANREAERAMRNRR